MSHHEQFNRVDIRYGDTACPYQFRQYNRVNLLNGSKKKWMRFYRLRYEVEESDIFSAIMSAMMWRKPWIKIPRHYWHAQH